MSDRMWRLYDDNGRMLEEGNEQDIVFAILDETAWAHGAERLRPPLAEQSEDSHRSEAHVAEHDDVDRSEADDASGNAQHDDDEGETDSSSLAVRPRGDDHSQPARQRPSPGEDARAYVQKLEVEGPGLKRRPWWWVDALVQQVAHNTPPEEVQVRSSPTAPERTTRPPVAADYDKDPILVEREVVLSLIAAMRTRPLVLLAGISGSGKTQVAKRLGKAWAAGWIHGEVSTRAAYALLKEHEVIKETNGKWCEILDVDPANKPWASRYGFTAVQSDWTDASHLWGYHVPLPEEARGFYGSTALRVFRDAWTAWDARRDEKQADPHFVLLDEMNLSRPEHYGSDLLSAMEVKAFVARDDKPAKPGEPVIELHRAGAEQPLRGEGSGGRTVPARIGWAPHLVVVGTVNVDETTHSFAPKVLDRAALLEFTDVQLDLVMQELVKGDDRRRKTWNLAKGWFTKVNKVLRPYNLHIGYRAAGEILQTLVERGAPEPEMSLDELLSRQLRDKVLPRIRGPRSAVETLLNELRPLARWSASTTSQEGAAKAAKLHMVDIDTELRNLGDHNDDEGSRAERKILEMLRRAHAVGFTSYFG